MQDNNTKKITTWGVGEFTPTDNVKGYDIEYVYCEDEKDLLTSFLGWWKDNTPDIITGWNSALFDIPYLLARTERILGEGEHKKFSPFGLVNKRKVRFAAGREMTAYELSLIHI